MDVIENHRNWLKDKEGLIYSIALEGKHKMMWMTEKKKYKDSLYSPEINCIGRLKDELIIEFDGTTPLKYSEIILEKFRNNKWYFTLSTHKGRCNYIWCKFKRNISDKEAEKFLKWIAPEGSEIDLNFASSNKVFPVLYAVHWKHSYQRELPIEICDGEKIDYDSIFKDQKVENEFEYKTYKKDNPFEIFTKKRQAEQFYNEQPFFYDETGLWWIWDKEILCYKKLWDDIQILDLINNSLGVDVIKSNDKNEIINALKLIGRRHIPKPINPFWVQFRNEIFDIKTLNIINPTPEYFVVNPIPYKLHKDKFMNTPTLDRIFEEWVGKNYVKTLYEILAYCLLPNYPINRLFCFVGSGMNGKSKFLELLTKFIGDDNCTSTELDTLLNSRFEVTRLHKKLVCQMGETNFNEITKTSILKKLTGGDMIGFEYKNKNPFHDRNYAKIIISTNNLPTTTDKTIGFYRRWMIIDFPNEFSEQKDILLDIPEEEYESLALKCCFILRDLLDIRKFHNEGSVQDRLEKYEAKADFLKTFIEKFLEEDVNGFVFSNEFNKRFNEWCNENRHRIMSDTSIALSLKQKGFEVGRKYFQWMFDGKGGQARGFLGLKWK